MGKRSPTKCEGRIPCLLNPLDLPSVCLSCSRCSHNGKKRIEKSLRPEPPRAIPGQERFTAWDNPPPEDAIETACAYCGRLFYAPANQIYCSRSCSKKAYRKRRAERGNKNRFFAAKKCVVCGKMYYPRTDRQQTCGGQCTKVFLGEKYGRGVPKNYPVEVRKNRVTSNMETRSNCPVQHLRECVTQLKRHNPRAAITPTSLDQLASLVSARLPWMRTISRPRQAVLLDIAISHGTEGLFGMTALLAAIRAGKWEKARQLLLNSRYAFSMAADGRGKFSVENARQLSTGAWTVIPEYIPQEDDDDVDDDDQYWL